MKYFLILLFLFSFKVEARYPICFEVLPIYANISKNHIKENSITPEYISKTLNTYFKIKDYRSNLFYDKERSLLLDQYKKKSEEIYEGLKKGDCNIYQKLDSDFEKYAKRWKSEALAQIKENKFPIKNLKRVEREEIEPRELKNKEEYLLIIKNFLNQHYDLYSKGEKKESFEKYIKKIFKEKKRLYTKDETRPSIILKSLFKTLDPHTDYMTDEEADQFNIGMNANQVGLGVSIQKKNSGVVEVLAVEKDSAAEKAGIKAGDKILSVDSKKVSEYSFNSILEIIRGEEGSSLDVEILRDGKTIKVTAIRKSFSVREVKLDINKIIHKDKNILHLFLPSFYTDSITKKGASDDIEKALKNNKDADLIVLDLRNNGGGILNEAIKIVGIFQKNPIVVGQQTKGGHIFRLSVDSHYLDEKTPLVILVNTLSASASEIVAGALKDYERAIILGDKHTYGKGTIQSVKPVMTATNSLGEVKITEGMFYLPKGETTQFQGVLSDIEIIRDNYKEYSERAFSNALKPTKIPPMITVKNSYRSEILEKLKSKVSTDIVKIKSNKSEKDLILNRALDISVEYFNILNSKVITH